MDTNIGKRLFIDLVHYPVYTLGIGKRIGIWFQGCNIGCNDCISTHNWKQKKKNKISVKEVLEKVKSYNSITDGITISGGEPFEQPLALYELLLSLRENNYSDIMVYSGYSFSFLKSKYSDILKLIDVLIDGQFIQGLETEYIWKGSENQNMYILTNNNTLKEEYIEYRDTKSEQRKLQIIEKNELLYVLGIPRQKDSGKIKNGFV